MPTIRWQLRVLCPWPDQSRRAVRSRKQSAERTGVRAPEVFVGVRSLRASSPRAKLWTTMKSAKCVRGLSPMIMVRSPTACVRPDGVGMVNAARTPRAAATSRRSDGRSTAPATICDPTISAGVPLKPIAFAMASVRPNSASISPPCAFRSRWSRGQSILARVAAARMPALSRRTGEVSSAS